MTIATVMDLEGLKEATLNLLGSQKIDNPTSEEYDIARMTAAIVIAGYLRKMDEGLV